jgi:hypothetical protein
MAALMDLVAGDLRSILLALSVEDWDALDDPTRFDAHLSLGGGLDPTWLDLFSEAVRRATGDDAPSDFIDARHELDGPGGSGDRVVERVDPGWIGSIARLPDDTVDAVAGRWIDLVEEELGFLPREEKPWIRKLAGDLVEFARAADRSADVIFAWAL